MVCGLRKYTLFLEVGLGFLSTGGGIISLAASSVAADIQRRENDAVKLHALANATKSPN
jgi:hypothetical protein